MKKIEVNTKKDTLHEALNISVERAEELADQIKTLVDNAEESGIVKFRESMGGVHMQVFGNIVLDIFMNEIAKSEEERLLIMCKYVATLSFIREYYGTRKKREGGDDLNKMDKNSF